MRLLLLLPVLLLCLFRPAFAYEVRDSQEINILDAFDPDRLTVMERKFLQTGLAFEGLYTAQIDGIWGRGSQQALERFSEKMGYSGKVHAFEAFILAGITRNILSTERWSYKYLADYKVSLLIPEKDIKTAATDEYAFEITLKTLSLTYTIYRGNFGYTKEIHDVFIEDKKVGERYYIERKKKYWITSVINRHGVTFYARSDHVGGAWTTVIVTASDWDLGNLAAVTGSITPGKASQLRLGDGYLSKGINAASQLLEEADRRKSAAEGLTAPDSRPPDEGSASTPEAATPPPAKGSAPKTASSGTGFAVSANGDLLTNNHVARDCSRLTVDGHEASLKATDETFDLALVHVPALRNEDFATFAENPAPLNSDVTVAGYPLTGLLSGLNVTRGSVTAMKGIGGDSTRMQISAPVQPGNSGGPAMNAYGHVVGVVAAKLDAQRVADAIGDIPQNVNFAVRGSMAKLFLHQNGISPRTAPAGDTLSPETIATRLTAITHFIECY